MVITHFRSKRKPSGGRYRSAMRKRQCDAGNLPTLPRLGQRILKKVRIKGGRTKNRILQEEFINVIDPSTHKASKTKIKNVVECPANKQYARRNILVKGTIVETELGRARVTNRPAQDGCVAGILVK